ncbi:MAG TPA: methyltransferase domain-containing protein [Verrucomicrobiae bacterium]|nr:methyltransferase domain-containing protein [Verrucomicrobiae bacterium]
MKSPREPAVGRRARTTPVCWCGNKALERFSDDYLRCAQCETLVWQRVPTEDVTRVRNDATDLYGRSYYQEHLQQSFGYPDLATRARTDLPERCLHWLRTVLKYKVPPGKALELGSAHGAFVALLRWAGFDAAGLELSPWVVDFATRTYQVPTLSGPIEDQTFAARSLDVVALMDVLEHLPDPLATIRQCVRLLKPAGMLVIQTPNYPAGRTYQQLVSEKSRFLEQLKPREHLFLFSQDSIKQFLVRSGLESQVFEPAIFGHYDMFVVASRQPLAVQTSDEIVKRLCAAPGGRLVLALLDLSEQLQELNTRHVQSEADRTARLDVIHEQGRRISELEAEVHRWLEEARTYSAQARQLESGRSELTRQLADSEADRAARLEVIHEQGRRISELEAEVHRWLEEAKKYTVSILQLEAARAGLSEQVSRLAEENRQHQSQLAEAGIQLNAARAELERKRAENESLAREKQAQESAYAREKMDLLGQLETSQRDLAAVKAEGARMSAEIAKYAGILARLETELAGVRSANESLTRELQTSRDENRNLGARLDTQSHALDGALSSLEAARLRIRELQEQFSEMNNHRLVRVLKACGLWRW